MKPQKSKHELRRELGEKIQEYLRTGGKVNTIPAGISGNATNSNLFKTSTQFEPKSDRTPLTEVVKALENRKNSDKTPPVIKKQKPKKRLIVDDFGDPIRWVWDE